MRAPLPRTALTSLFRCGSLPIKAWLMSLLLVCVLSAQEQTTDWLEQGIDTYLMLLYTSPEEAYLQLDALHAQVNDQTATDSLTRLYASFTLHYLHTGQTEQVEPALERILTYARIHGSTDSMVEALATKVEVCFVQQRLNEAYRIIVELEPYLAHAQQPRVRYYANNLLGRIYMQDNHFELASEHLYRALEAVQETNDDRTLLRSTFLLGQLTRLHADMKNWELAEELMQQALSYADQIASTEFLADYLLLKGYIEGEQGNHEASALTHHQAIVQAEIIDRQDIILLSLNNIGASYILLHQYDAAIEPLHQAKKLAKALDDENTYQLVLLNLAYIDVQQGRTEQGLTQMRESINYFREHARRSDLERFLGEFANALQHAGYHLEEAAILREQRDLSNELFQSDRHRILSEMQQRFLAREQAHRIQRLEQTNALQERTIENKQLQNRLILLAAFATALAGVLMWQLYRKVRHTNRRLKEANKQLEFQSLRDPLTGLFNRRSFQQRMAKRWQHKEHRHHGQERDALILLDIDHFKQINDQHGHAAGDDILIEVAKRLSQSLRQHDQAIRWGGEEFLLYLHRIKPKDLSTLVERTLYLLAEKPFLVNGQSIVVTATAGFITLPFDNIPEEKLNWEKALQLADLALYSGKAKGRNQACGVTGLRVPLADIMQCFEQDQSQPLTLQQLTCSTIAGPSVHRT